MARENVQIAREARVNLVMIRILAAEARDAHAGALRVHGRVNAVSTLMKIIKAPEPSSTRNL